MKTPYRAYVRLLSRFPSTTVSEPDRLVSTESACSGGNRFPAIARDDHVRSRNNRGAISTEKRYKRDEHCDRTFRPIRHGFSEKTNSVVFYFSSPPRVQTDIPRASYGGGFFSFFVPPTTRVLRVRRAGIERDHRRGGRKNASASASGGRRFIGRSASPRPHAPSGSNAFASNDFPNAYRRRALITLPERLLSRTRVTPPSRVIQMTDPPRTRRRYERCRCNG